ncbi:MAG: BatD family protein [Balneolaceae bacterium]|nr:BatD family protein [Balneolaceae bacterium]
MIRTGKVVRRLWPLFLIVFAFTPRSAAQNVEVEATVSETQIYTGERVSLSVRISGNFKEVQRPDLSDIDGFSFLNSSPSVSRQYSIINGNASYNYSYSYILVAQQTGDYRIPPIAVTVDGEIYRTDPIEVSVINRSTSPDPKPDPRDDIFLKLEVSDEQPVTGQQLITNLTLYFKSGIEVRSYQLVPGWKAEGFWKEELISKERPQSESVILDGVRFRKARLLQYALFPTKSGELTISPFEIVVSVRKTRSFDDPLSSFFSGFGSNEQRVNLLTDPVTIDVEGLPPISDASTVGAVGSFNFERSLNTRTAMVGETIEISTTIKGSGNIPLISKPDYELPQGLEIYDPQENTSINRDNQRISGTKTYTDIVIPRKPGNYSIPEEKLVYFNPASGRYVTETLPPLNFSVRRNPDADITSPASLSFDIKPVTGLATWIQPEDRPLTARWWFWAGILLPAIIIGVAYRQKIYRDRMRSDRSFARSEQAGQHAEERLQQAIRYSDQEKIKEAYNSLHKALTGFIGDKLDLPEAGLSDHQYLSELDSRGVDSETIRKIRMLLNKSATISYAPDVSHDYLKSHVGLAEEMINQLKEEL